MGTWRAIKKTIVELDLRGYSEIVTVHERQSSADFVHVLQREIQGLIDEGLVAVGIARENAVLRTEGDNAFVNFDRAEDAHCFAGAVHNICRFHNQGKTIPTEQRWFRIGIATGEVPTEGKGLSCVTFIRANRLEAAANAGEIVMDEATYRELPPKLQALYGPREMIQDKHNQQYEVYRFVVVALEEKTENNLPKIVRPKSIWQSVIPRLVIYESVAVIIWIGAAFFQKQGNHENSITGFWIGVIYCLLGLEPEIKNRVQIKNSAVRQLAYALWIGLWLGIAYIMLHTGSFAKSANK